MNASVLMYIHVELRVASSLSCILVTAFSLYQLFFKHASEVFFSFSFAAALTS